MKKTTAIILLAGGMFLGTGCHSQHHADEHHHSDEHTSGHAQESDEHHHADEIVFTQEQAEAAGLKTEVAAASPFRFVIHTSGQVQAQQGDEQTIVAPTSGTLFFTNASITEGASLRKGEAIVSISAGTLQDGDPATKAKLAFEAAEKEFLRAERLVADTIISIKEFEQIRMRYETAKASYQGIAANHSTKGVSVASPLAGYLKNRLVAQGEYVTTGQPIAVVAQNKRLQLRADVPESHFKQLRSIQDANFKTSYDDTVYQLSALNGRLLSYGKTVAEGSPYLPVIFEFDNIGDIIPGAFADIYLLSDVQQRVISVPLSALTEEQGSKFVYIQIEDDAYKKQEVVVGQSDGTRIEILKGLEEGDIVVTDGSYHIKLATASTAIPEHHHH